MKKGVPGVSKHVPDILADLKVTFARDSVIKELPSMQRTDTAKYRVKSKEDGKLIIHQYAGDRVDFYMVITLVDNGRIKIVEPKDPFPLII